MKVAYLVNRYPKASHSFIRREIHGLEEQGVEVVRITVRPWGEDLVDPGDLEEARKTHVLLGRGVVGLLGDLLWGFGTRPLRTLRAMGLAWRQGRASDRGRAAHFAYLAEALGLVRLAEREDFRHVHAHFGTNPPAVCALAERTGAPGFQFHGSRPGGVRSTQRLKLGEKDRRGRVRGGHQRVRPQSAVPLVAALRLGTRSTWFTAASTDASSTRSRPRCRTCRASSASAGLCEQKGQLLLVQATAELLRRGHEVELVLAGDGEMRPEIEACIERAGIGARVRITGWATGDQVREEILGARAMVLPSFAEGLPVVLDGGLGLAPPGDQHLRRRDSGARRSLESAGGSCQPAMWSLWWTPCRKSSRLRWPTSRPWGRTGAERVRARHDIRTEQASCSSSFGGGA